MNGLIERSELLELSMPVSEFVRHHLNTEHVVSVNQIRRAAVVDAEPVRHGRWEDIKGAIRCSECQNTPLYDYHGRLVLAVWCPVCGAKMWKKRGEENGKGD